MKSKTRTFLLMCAIWGTLCGLTITKEFCGQQENPSEYLSLSLNGIEPLKVSQNIFVQQREQILAYFLRQIAVSPGARDSLWKPNFSSTEAYLSSISGHRKNLEKMLGLFSYAVTKPQITTLETGGGVHVEDVAISLDVDLKAQALLFLPNNSPRKAAVIVVPPETETREHFAGIAAGMKPAKWLTTLLQRGIAVCIPITVERTSDHPLSLTLWRRGRDQRLPLKDRRHILHRLGFIVGRPLVGIEVEQVVALQKLLASRSDIDPRRIGVFGERQGGMTALYAAAVDRQLSWVIVVNYFQQREGCWREPVDRMLYGQLNEFGDAEVAALIAPRPLAVVYTPGGPTPAMSVKEETERALRFYRGLGQPDQLTMLGESEENALEATASRAATLLGAKEVIASPTLELRLSNEIIEKTRNDYFDMLHTYLRRIDAESDAVRKERWRLNATLPQDRGSRAAALQAELRNMMGTIPEENIPLHPRLVPVLVSDKFIAYDVLLDVVHGVEAFGQLLVPRRAVGRVPAVICQHGSGGRPSDVTGIGENPDRAYYHGFAARLAERGYVTFAPYLSVQTVEAMPISSELIDTIVRQAAAVGKMRTSMELAKLHRIVDFLQSLPFVNGDRIGYYGLSYGGYSAIWMSPLEPRLKATVVSGNFNDWRAKITDEENNTSYLLHPDEDFYNWDVLHRFTHVELIAATWPRPECIEFGEHDGVTIPEWTARTWAQVKELDDAWGPNGRVVLDHFDGQHEIHGIGSFDFLARRLWPEISAGRDFAEDLLPNGRARSGFEDGQQNSMPYDTHRLDSRETSEVQGAFYVSSKFPVMTGLALRMSRVGMPGDLLLRLGSQPGGKDLGQARVPAQNIDSGQDFWHEVKLDRTRLDPSKLYWFEVTAAAGHEPQDYYLMYGPQPLAGKDFPTRFGVAFRILTEGESLGPSRQESVSTATGSAVR